jgi:hypothetical protein
MRNLRPFFIVGPPLLALLLCACGNKGDLVKPNPSTLPPPTSTPEPNASDAVHPAPAAQPAQPVPTPEPPQDSDGP